MFKGSYDPSLFNCACANGPNEGKTYDCEDPCYEGYYFDKFMCECYPKADPCAVTISVKSWLTWSDGNATVDTFIPSVPDVRPGQPVRVFNDVVQKSTGPGWNEWEDVMLMPYRVGDDYDGHTLTSVIHKAKAAITCD